MKNRTAFQLAPALLVLMTPGPPLAVPARAGGELTDPFVCLQDRHAASAELPGIVLVEAELYGQRDLIDARLRRVAAAATGSADDVRVLVSGMPYQDERCLEYKEWRVGGSLAGRVQGFEGAAACSLAGQVAPLFALAQRMTAEGALAELRRKQLPTAAIKLQALRNLYLLPVVTRGWRSTSRPVTVCRDADPAHVAAVEQLFELVARSATEPESALPAPDAPEFDEEVLAPWRAAFEDDMAFLLVLRAHVLELVLQCEALPTGCEDVAPSYRPDLAGLREAAADGIFRVGGATGRALEDLLLGWRLYAAASNIAREYCASPSGRPLEVIVAPQEMAPLKALLERFAGARIPISSRPIAD